MSRNRTSKWITPERRVAIYQRDGMRCVYCGRDGRPNSRFRHGHAAPHGIVPGLALDHVDPRCEGGGNESENLVTVCARCNRDKSGRSLKRWVAPMSEVRRMRILGAVRLAVAKPVDLLSGKEFLGVRAARPLEKFRRPRRERQEDPWEAA